MRGCLLPSTAALLMHFLARAFLTFPATACMVVACISDNRHPFPSPHIACLLSHSTAHPFACLLSLYTLLYKAPFGSPAAGELRRRQLLKDLRDAAWRLSPLPGRFFTSSVRPCLCIYMQRLILFLYVKQHSKDRAARRTHAHMRIQHLCMPSGSHPSTIISYVLQVSLLCARIACVRDIFVVGLPRRDISEQNRRSLWTSTGRCVA